MASISNLYVKPELVHRGGWRNWDSDAATGGQITMLKDDAELLSIFIGIFLVFVAAGLWTLIAYLIFQLNRRKRQQEGPGSFDALYHQQQTILRNGSSDIAIGSAFLKLWLAWGNNPKVLKSILPIVVLALVSFGFFLIALPFITAMEMLDKQGNQVLIKSPKCGFWEPDIDGDLQGSFTVVTKQTLEAASYVDNCYETDAESALCDQFLPKRQLPILRVHNVPCPFHKSVCLPWTEGGKPPAITVQTDELDSHKDFGINAPPEERIKFRRSTTCSPLNVNKYGMVFERMTGENFTGIFFGPSAVSNWTYTYGVSDWQFVAEPSYTLSGFYWRPFGNVSYIQLFEPIPELRRNDADLTVVFFNNNNVYMLGKDGPCTDPFFSATKLANKDLLPDHYMPDSPITAIGCIDQYQFSKAGSDEWTPLASFADSTTNMTFVDQLSIKQVAAHASIRWALHQAGGIDMVIENLRTEALRAKRYPGLRHGVQNPLPNDQWMREVEYWFMIGLAKVQLGVINVALGPQDPENSGLRDNTTFIVQTRKNLMDYVCTSQKIHSLEFKNLHKAGFIALAVLGGLSIILPSLVLRTMIWWRKRQPEVLTWTSYGLLQFLRMAVEGAGIQGWERVDEDVPLLKPHDQPSGDVDVRNVGADGLPHPVWARSVSDPTLVGGSVTRSYDEYRGGHLKDESNEVFREVMPSGPERAQGYGQRMQGGYNQVSGREVP
ncbi:hypothetical protein CEP51_005160 [Fusarium floridanum]|uniref:Uncharacterized protein n=1 Tax=Fusarium floridanum TaxID=1325733 RepID=A0A428RY54_9HYPO|nr:hypothetical protein CEP51_005160 [Fusarium floridanum]